MGHARKVVHRSTHRLVGAIPCFGKNPEMVEWESELERDAINILRFHPDVTHIDSQVRWIEYIDEHDQVHKHCPDLYLIFKDKPIWIEVKYQNQVEKFAKRTQLIKELLRLEGGEYVMFDESIIRIEPRLSNIELLLRYQQIIPTTAIRQTINQFFAPGFSISIAELIELHGLDLPTVYSLICHHILRTDLHLPVNQQSIVSQFISGREILSDEEIFG